MERTGGKLKIILELEQAPKSDLMPRNILLEYLKNLRVIPKNSLNILMINV